MVPVVGFRGFQGKDKEISDSRIVISSEARNLPCRPINDRCVKAEIRSAKVSFPCQCLCLLSRIAVYPNQRSPAAVNRLLGTHFPTLFHTASALSAPSGHLPLEGKADDTREPAIKSPSGIASIYTSRRFHILCAAPPFLISNFSFLIRAKLSSAIHGRGAHGLTRPLKPQPSLRFFLTFSRNSVICRKH